MSPDHSLLGPDPPEPPYRLGPRGNRKYEDWAFIGDCLLIRMLELYGQPSDYDNYGVIKASGWSKEKFIPEMLYADCMMTSQCWERGDFFYDSASVGLLFVLSPALDIRTCVLYYWQKWQTPPTLARYFVWIAPLKGVIYVVDAVSPLKPMYQEGKWPDLSAYPPATEPLQRMSDFVFLAHRKMCGEKVDYLRNLEWVIHDHVDNEATELVMKAAWTADGSEEPWLNDLGLKWPGKTFMVGDKDKKQQEAAKALIGCPNGSGIAFMLLQHQEYYGGCVIDGIRIFANDNGWASLAWHIKQLSYG